MEQKVFTCLGFLFLAESELSEHNLMKGWIIPGKVRLKKRKIASQNLLELKFILLLLFQSMKERMHKAIEGKKPKAMQE